MLYLRKFKVYHSDIKCENILIDSNFDIKICDFGLSKILDNNNLTNSKGGTKGSRAPEVEKDGNQDFDGFKADVFSLGYLLFYMYSGFTPFKEAK